MKTSSLLLLIFVALTLGSCKTFDHAMVKPQDDPIAPKLLTLERQVGDFANTTVIANDIEMKLVSEEIEKNLIDPYGDKFGHIAYSRNVIEWSEGFGYMALNSFLVSVPALFGAPWWQYTLEIEIELRVLDRNQKLIGKYKGIGTAKAPVGYYSFKDDDAKRKVITDALNNAFSKIRPQIQADVERLNQELREAGKL